MGESCFLYGVEDTKHILSAGYEVVIGSAELILADFFDKNPKVNPVVIADENTLEHCWPKVIGRNERLNHAPIIQIESGEENKSVEVCMQVWLTLAEMKLTRNDVVINLGGGVVTDLGGFVASTFKRGVKFIQVPTSLLCMVDAAVGGKVGVDLQKMKNLVGNFATPELVVVDTEFLDTLSANQMRSGFAEVLKHGLILDKSYWTEACSASFTDIEHIRSLVSRSIELKNEIVLEDFKESGNRKKLNFGHTIGHAIETYFLESDTPLLHGEAVAAGMLAESWLSTKLSGLTEGELEQISNYIRSVYTFPILSTNAYENLIQLMKNDKKNRGDEINCTLLNSIGESSINHKVEEQLICQALDYTFGN